MGRFQQDNPITLPSNSAISRFRRVVMAAGFAVLANASQRAFAIQWKQTQTTDPAVEAVTLNADGTVVMVANGAISQYAKVYAADNGKVGASGGVLEGIALQAATADGDEIEVLPQADNNNRFFVSVAGSTVITNTVAETTFDQNVTLPTHALKAGDELDIEAAVAIPSTNSTDTLNVKLYIGATVIAATGALDVANNDVAIIRARLTVRTDGAGGTLVASGEAFIGTPGTANYKPFILASTAIDTTATQQIKATATWSVANAGDQARLDRLSVRRFAA
jgi:hypothetical protein